MSKIIPTLKNFNIYKSYLNKPFLIIKKPRVKITLAIPSLIKTFAYFIKILTIISRQKPCKS